MTESLLDIKDTASVLQETLMGSDRESIRMAEKSLQQLVGNSVSQFLLLC